MYKRQDMESPGRPSVTRIIVWVWIFAFAYGVGGEFTKMSYSTAAAKLGVFVAALIIALGIVLASKRLDYSVFYRLSFVFMAFGFVVSLVVDNPALMQACMSASNALVKMCIRDRLPTPQTATRCWQPSMPTAPFPPCACTTKSTWATRAARNPRT